LDIYTGALGDGGDIGTKRARTAVVAMKVTVVQREREMLPEAAPAAI
jgi:hypothetical protein